MATAASPSVQMNVRLNGALKERGDTALALMGYSPSDAVRAIWSLACGKGTGLSLLEAALKRGSEVAAGVSQDAVNVCDVVSEGQLLYAAACARVGITAPRAHGLSDEELLEQALVERLEERGLA